MRFSPPMLLSGRKYKNLCRAGGAVEYVFIYELFIYIDLNEEYVSTAYFKNNVSYLERLNLIKGKLNFWKNLINNSIIL